LHLGQALAQARDFGARISLDCIRDFVDIHDLALLISSAWAVPCLDR
jgi:hypothetical protein